MSGTNCSKKIRYLSALPAEVFCLKLASIVFSDSFQYEFYQVVYLVLITLYSLLSLRGWLSLYIQWWLCVPSTAKVRPVPSFPSRSLLYVFLRRQTTLSFHFDEGRRVECATVCPVARKNPPHETVMPFVMSCRAIRSTISSSAWIT